MRLSTLRVGLLATLVLSTACAAPLSDDDGEEGAQAAVVDDAVPIRDAIDRGLVGYELYVLRDFTPGIVVAELRGLRHFAICRIDLPPSSTAVLPRVPASDAYAFARPTNLTRDEEGRAWARIGLWDAASGASSKVELYLSCRGPDGAFPTLDAIVQSLAEAKSTYVELRRRQ